VQELVEDKAAQAAVMGFDPPPADAIINAEAQARMDNLIAQKVAEGIAAALPAVLAQIASSQTAADSFAAGMGPSDQVNMSIAGATSVTPQATYLKHYRLDDAVNGKHQLLDVSKLDDRGQLIVERQPDGKLNIPAVQKGRFINFVGGHFYATEEIEVAFIEHLMKTNPMCKIYEDSGTTIIPCGVANCEQFFGDVKGLEAHMRATHGIGR
jgi:hypothetical protein